MSKTTSLFLCFFLFVLIAMPTSSATRGMILAEDVRGCPGGVNSCEGVVCYPQVFCPIIILECPDGLDPYKPFCSCTPICCPPLIVECQNGQYSYSPCCRCTPICCPIIRND
ncbi:hypothetical protein MKX03_003380 [Papaver bracteatum]|nr:hypothetical protein MKX03_003380 [Papaver bracteatum]